MAVLLQLAGCSALGFKAEQKANWQSFDNSETTPAVRAALSKKSAALTNSPTMVGTEFDFLSVKQIVDLLKPKGEKLEFKDVVDCQKNQIKVCTALKGCFCELDRKSIAENNEHESDSLN